MKLSEFKKIIKEEINLETKQSLSEGIVDKLVSAIIDKVVRSKYKNYFDALKNDPEYQEALRGVRLAVDRIDAAGESAVKAQAIADKTYKDYVKKYGKAAADNMVVDVNANKFKWGRWTAADRKRYTGSKN
jgi:uncharacterized protein YaaR (DUF327 family)